MYTLEGLDKDYVKKIYQNTILYSIYKYNELDETIKPIYNNRYQNALKLKDELEIIDTPSKEEVKNFLQEQKAKVKNIQDQNQEAIDQVAQAILQTLINEMPKDLTDIEKCQYIFDFVTKTMKFDEDWYQYCANVPPIDDFHFMFDNGVPESKSYGGLLVTRIGNSDDITNLMVFLGNSVGISIEKTYCKHNSKRRAINCITTDNGSISYMDPIAVIRKEKEKKDVFLVKGSQLDYHVNSHFSTAPFVPEPRYNMEEIINKANNLLPDVNYIEYNEVLEK